LPSYRAVGQFLLSSVEFCWCPLCSMRSVGVVRDRH
jgi:hypothetical protein